MSEEFWQIDFPALVIVILASVQCALLGSFLVLKKQAVMIDAISHSVLPGLVVGAIVSGTLYMPYIMIGAVISALLAVLCVQVIHRLLKIEQGAATGIIFTVFFSLGVVLLETQLSSRIHLDTQHVLYGALEMVYWKSVFDWHSMPEQMKALGVMFIVTLAIIILMYKELRLSAFDPSFALLVRIRPFFYNLMFLVLCALVAVTCFEAMGSILVIALFVCPAACARLMTDRMHTQLLFSACIACVCAILGYLFAIQININSSASIAFFCGLTLIVVITVQKLNLKT